MIANYNVLKRRYSTHEYGKKMLEAQLHRTETSKNAIDMERNRLKPVLKSLQEQKQQHLRYCTLASMYSLYCVYWSEKWLRNHPQFLLHFLIHIDVLMLCRKFELIPT